MVFTGTHLSPPLPAMEMKTSPVIAQIVQAVTAAAITYFAYTYIIHLNYKRHLARIPRLRSQQIGSNEETRQTYLKSAKALYREGYENVSGRMVPNALEEYTD